MPWTLHAPGLALTVALTVPSERISVANPIADAKFKVIGRPRAVTIQDGIEGQEFSIPARVKTLAQYQELRSILTAQQILRLTVPTGEQWWVVVTSFPETWDPIVSTGGSLYRTVQIGLRETDAPT